MEANQPGEPSTESLTTSLQPELSPQPKPSKTPTLLLTLTTFLTVCGLVFFYLHIQSLKLYNRIEPSPPLTTNPTRNPSPSTLPLSIFTDKYSFGSSIATEFSKQAEINQGTVLPNDRSWVWWVSPDKLNIINNNEIGIEYFYNKCESDLRKAAFNTIASELSLNIKPAMVANGFKYSQENSSSSITDILENNYALYDYIQAYENEGTKCILVANPDCSTNSDSIPLHYTFSFTCTDNYQKNYSEQSPYLKDLGINNAIVHVANKVDDFAKLNINYRRTGSYAIVKKVNDVWTKIYSGQDNPGCNVMEKYQIPQEIYESCWTDDTTPVLQ